MVGLAGNGLVWMEKDGLDLVFKSYGISLCLRVDLKAIKLKFPPPASPEQLLYNVLDPPKFLEIDDIVFDAESVDTSLVSHFLNSDDESNDD
ncbi:hypothetical protein Tco_1175108 [Tanacetum coccineum]